MGGRGEDQLPNCADFLLDVVENYSPAASFIPVEVNLSLSEGDDRKHNINRSRMLAKQQHEFALDVRQGLLFSVTGVLPFWMGFGAGGPIRRVDLWQTLWENHRTFDCIYMEPVRGLDTKHLHYSARSMQQFHVMTGDQGLQVQKITQPGSVVGRPPPLGTFEDMAEQFLQLIKAVGFV